MTASVGGGISFANSPDGHGYLSLNLGVELTGILSINGSINTFAGGMSINPGLTSPLIPGSSLGGSLLAPLLPPILAPLVGSLLGAIPTGPVGSAQEPPAGSTTLIDLGGTIINLPGAFS